MNDAHLIEFLAESVRAPAHTFPTKNTSALGFLGYVTKMANTVKRHADEEDIHEALEKSTFCQQFDQEMI